MAPSSKSTPKRPWEEIAKDAQDYRDASMATFVADFPAALDSRESSELPKNSTNVPGKILQERDLQITESLPEELIELLANGDLSATEVTTAFLRRAALAQKLVNSPSPNYIRRSVY
jgi:hypothetical protein